MADGIKTVTDPSGPNVATDEVTRNSVVEHEQVIKIALGAENAFDCLVDSGQQVMANSIPVVFASDQTALPVTRPPVVTTGTITANGQSVTATLTSVASDCIGIAIGGTFTGATVLQLEGSSDNGSNYFAVSFRNAASIGSGGVITIDVAGSVRYLIGSTAGLTHLRLRCSAFQAGDNVTIRFNVLPLSGTLITEGLLDTIRDQQTSGAQLTAIYDPGSGFQAVINSSGQISVTGPLTQTQLNSSLTLVDNAAFTDGATKVQSAGFIYDEVAGTALTENDVGAARMDAKRAIVCVTEDATTRGQRQAVLANNAAKIDFSSVAGTTVVVGNGVTSAGSPRVTIASDNTPFGIKVTDGTNTAGVNTILGFATSLPNTTKAIDTIAHFAFMWDSGYPDTPGASNAAFGGVMNDRGDFMVGLGSIRNSPLNVGHGTATTYSAGVTAQDGSQRVAQAGASTAAITRVVPSLTSVVALAAQTRRACAVFCNESKVATIKLAFGSSVTAVSYTKTLAPGEEWPMFMPVYTGAINALWDVLDGALEITELT